MDEPKNIAHPLHWERLIPMIIQTVLFLGTLSAGYTSVVSSQKLQEQRIQTLEANDKEDRNERREILRTMTELRVTLERLNTRIEIEQQQQKPK